MSTLLIVYLIAIAILTSIVARQIALDAFKLAWANVEATIDKKTKLTIGFNTYRFCIPAIVVLTILALKV